MRDLVKQYLDAGLSRRDFGKALIALGLTATAAESVVSAVAEAAEPDSRDGFKFTGTGAEVLVETLRAANVQYLFCTTATGMSSLFDALSSRMDVNLILSIAESQATSMAHGYELGSRETAALFLPGVAVPSAMNNLYNAWKDRSAIAVYSDSPRNVFRGRNMFQQMDDWLSPMVEFTKWRWRVDSTRQIGEMTRRAIKMAGTPPGGPVHIRYPLDILATKKVSETIYPQSRFTVNANMQPDPGLIEQSAKMLLEAERPLIHAGAEVTRAGANRELVELAELLGIPVAQGFSCYGDFPFRNPLFAGFYGMGVPRGLAKTDVYLNLGTQMPDPAIFTAPVPKKASVIHARIEYEDIASIYPTDVAIAAGIKETIVALTDSIKSMATADRLAKISEARMEEARRLAAERDAGYQELAKKNWDASPLSWERVSMELEDQLERNAILVSELDYRTPYKYMNLGPDPENEKWLIGPSTGFALGWGIGAALGVKIAQPDRQVICMLGDGAMLFGQIEALWSASRYEIPVMIVVMNNVSYDGERQRIWENSPLASRKDTREQWKDMTCYLGDPEVDFVGLAKSFSIPGQRATNPREFKKAVKQARAITAEGRPFLIDARIMQLGVAADENWYPDISIAAGRAIDV
ncbi:MAG: thiamine pyrophosphate-binding protein [Gammaproteobacteria bacterium]|jgi:thiamine pyrophosphate-dependent acetolactate synthase large subunit-like protein